jgi:uncharacterized protein with FMN-binding domain
MSRKKLILICITFVFSLVFIGQGIRLYIYKSRISSLSFTEIKITDVNDGQYNGYYDLDYVKVNVDVNVKNGKIIAINANQKNVTKQFKRAKEIVNQIIKTQTLKIDAVSGATASSKAILKATEIALKKGL